MACQIKDITSQYTHCIFSNQLELSSFFGSAICLNLSHVHHTDIIDTYKLKKAIELNKQQIKRGDIVLVYTGHSDRFYNTEFWEKRRTAITFSAVGHLKDLGVKHIAIDVPFLISNVEIMSIDIPITLSVRNIGHLVDMRFIFSGFPVLERKTGDYLLRAAVLI